MSRNNRQPLGLFPKAPRSAAGSDVEQGRLPGQDRQGICGAEGEAWGDPPG